MKRWRKIVYDVPVNEEVFRTVKVIGSTQGESLVINGPATIEVEQASQEVE